MRIKIKIIFIAIFVLSSSGSVLYSFDKVGTTSFQFLKVMMSARASALGGAFSSIANNSDAVFWNPSGLARISGFDASANYVNWLFDAAHYSFAASYHFEDIGTFGLHGIFTDVGSIEVTRADALGFINGVYNPGLTGEIINPTSLVIGLSYSRNLTDKFSFGITGKYVREDLVYGSAGAMVFDAGLLFETGFKSIVVAASIMNFGPTVKFIDRSYPLPQTFIVGSSVHLISANDPLLVQAEDHDILLCYDMVQPRDFGQQHSIGLEYSFKNMFSLRSGYKFNGDQEGLSAGVGINFNNYRIDYSFNDYGEYLNSVHKVSIGIAVN